VSSDEATQLLDVEHVGEHTIGRFTRRTILDGDAINAVGVRLRQLLNEEGRRRFILNFARVESLPSAMLGTLAAVCNEIDAVGGRLAFCGVDAFLARIFAICNLPAHIPVYRDEQEALQALAGPG
jgi:anti-anti-sigma factor